MLTDSGVRAPGDTSRVNMTESWEVQYWCTRFGCTEVELRDAVSSVGPSAAEVERQIRQAGKAAFRNTGED